MELAVIGINHKSAPLEVRERLAIGKGELAAALAALRRRPGVTECVILSTCNRSELYVGGHEGPFGLPEAAGFLATERNLDRAAFEGHLYEYKGIDAVRHLFRVACSIDSMVVGETQIMRQVKEGYQAACREGTTGKFFNRLFQTAFRVAKRVHATSSIGERKVSVSSLAVDFAQGVLGDLAGKTAMVIGTGEMAELLLQHLTERGIGATVVVSRSLAKAAHLAGQVGGEASGCGEIEERLAGMDIVIASSGAPHFVIGPDLVRRVMAKRGLRSLLFIDIAVPRDVDPEVGSIEGVHLCDLDDLHTVSEANRLARTQETRACMAIIDAEVAEFAALMRLGGVEPLIARLNEQMALIGREESARTVSRLGDLGEEHKREIARMAERMVRKILHGPLLVLREAARNGSDGTTIEAARKLFDLGSDGKEKR